MSIVVIKEPNNTIVLTEAVGLPGPPGPAGEGVAAGGTIGQVLTKQSSTDFDTDWEDPAGGSQRPPNVLTVGPTGADAIGPTGADYTDIQPAIDAASAGDKIKIFDLFNIGTFIVDVSKNLSIESGNDEPLALFGLTGFGFRIGDGVECALRNFFVNDRVIITNQSATGDPIGKFYNGFTEGAFGQFDLEDREFAELLFKDCDLFLGTGVEEMVLVDRINTLSIINSRLTYSNSGEFAFINRNTAAVNKTINLEFTNMEFDPQGDADFNGVFHSNVLNNASEINIVNYTGNNNFRFIGDYTAQQLQDFLFPAELAAKISLTNGFVRSDNGYFKIVDNVVIEMAEAEDDETTTNLPANAGVNILSTAALLGGDGLVNVRGVDYTSDGTLIVPDSSLQQLRAYSVDPDTGLMARIFTLNLGYSPDEVWIDRVNDYIFVDNSSNGGLNCLTWDGSSIVAVTALANRACGNSSNGPFGDFIFTDGTYYYGTDTSGAGSNEIFAFTFDGVTVTEIASAALPGNRGSGSVAYDPVGQYIFVGENIGGFNQDIRVYTFDGVSFTLEAGTFTTGLDSGWSYDTAENALVIADIRNNNLRAVTYNGVAFAALTPVVNIGAGIGAFKMVNNYVFLAEASNSAPNINYIYQLSAAVMNQLDTFNTIAGASGRFNVSDDFIIVDNFGAVNFQTTKFIDPAIFTVILQYSLSAVDSVRFEYAASKTGNRERGQVTVAAGVSNNAQADKQNVTNPPAEDVAISFSSDIIGDNFRVLARNDNADFDILLTMFNFDERLST